MKQRRSIPALLRLRPLGAVGAVLLAASITAWAPVHRAASAGAGEARPARLAAVGAGGARLASLGAVAADSGVPGRAAVRAEAALAVLAAGAARTSDPAALRTAFQAYYRYRAAHADEVRKPYLYFVDLGLDNATPRGWVFDMDSLALVDGPFPVAHGRGSGPRQGVPKRFSNSPGSYASALGLYLAQETYQFTGKSAGRRYASTGLRLRGESGQFNGAALARGIVAHGAPYVTGREAGRSEGCPALEPARAERLLPLVSRGGVVFIYSPNDARWLASDPWINPGGDVPSAAPAPRSARGTA